MPGAREDWFSTSVWYFDHPDPGALAGPVGEVVAAERVRDAHGLPGRSNVLGWHSKDDLHQRPGMEGLVAHIGECVEEVVQFQCWDRTRVAPLLASCWAIVNPPGASNAAHVHPNCVLSGVYYVEVPEECGDLYFADPRTEAIMLSLPVTRHTPWTYQRVVYHPRPGRLLLFPAWLYHGVEVNRGERDRVVISFNIGLRWLST